MEWFKETGDESQRENNQSVNGEIMSKFTIEFKTDNDSFSNENFEFEIFKILSFVGRRVISKDDLTGIIKDSNGNNVGFYKFDEEN